MTTPDQPILFHICAVPTSLASAQRTEPRGQQELLSMKFADFELKIRDQFARMLAAGGFDPAEDIVAITVNRWPNGYAYTYDTLADPDVPPEQRPHVIGRQRLAASPSPIATRVLRRSRIRPSTRRIARLRSCSS